MKKSSVEVIVGIFVLLGIVCMAYISVQLGQVDFFNKTSYPLTASFTTVTGLKKDTAVEMAGVRIGSVQSIKLDNYQAVVTLQIYDGVKVQEDAIASIRTKGILGENYVEIQPGASDIVLEANEMIFDTEPPFDLMSVIKNFVIEE